MNHQSNEKFISLKIKEIIFKQESGKVGDLSVELSMTESAVSASKQ